MTMNARAFDNEAIQGVVFVPSKTFRDGRGETLIVFEDSLSPAPAKQALISTSDPGVLRGLHLHARQWDVWHLLDGTAEIALVDLRRRSHRADQIVFLWEASERGTLFIPPGVAHGYLALSRIQMLYILSEEYDPSDEYSIAWNDPQLRVGWSLRQPILSERDASAPKLSWDSLPVLDRRDVPRQ